MQNTAKMQGLGRLNCLTLLNDPKYNLFSLHPKPMDEFIIS